MCSLRGGGNKNPPLRRLPLLWHKIFLDLFQTRLAISLVIPGLILVKCVVQSSMSLERKTKFGTVPGGEDVGRVPPPVWYKGVFCIQ